MKGICEYIKEAEDTITKIRNVIVTYNIVPNKVTIALPSNYSESDMQIYLDDRCLNELPGSNDASKKMLGDNIDEINDAYFEYKKFDASDKPSNTVTLEWDSKYDSNNSTDTFTYYTLEELKYILDFSEFNLKNSEDIDDELNDIFDALASNSLNNYPFKIELADITYDE